ncbi:MAG: hypothetical protein WC479_08375 [Candidatus Izemoplasmatales bacterium]|jgi:hypothetical protein
MKVTEKVLNAEEKERLHDFMDSPYWLVFKKLLDNDSSNLLQQIAVSNFDQEFFSSKGQLLQNERIKSELKRIYKDVEKNKKNKNIK